MSRPLTTCVSHVRTLPPDWLRPALLWHCIHRSRRSRKWRPLVPDAKFDIRKRLLHHTAFSSSSRCFQSQAAATKRCSEYTLAAPTSFHLSRPSTEGRIFMAAPADDAAISSLHCIICGDDASAFNFGALSCESCKAFFRRATRSNKVPTCVFSGDCLVSLRTRRFCAACRLRKCQTAGMNKCLVLSDEQRRDRQQTIADNRLRKRSTHTGRFRHGHAGQQALCEVTSLPPFTDSSHQRVASIQTPSVAAVDKETPSPPLPFPRSVASSQSLPSEQQQLQRSDQVGVVRPEPVGDWNCCGGGALPEAAGITAPTSINASPSQRVLPPLGGHLTEGISFVVRCDVSWSPWSHQQPAPVSAACPDGGSAGYAGEATSPRLPKQTQLAAPSSASSVFRRRLSTQASDVLNVLTTLYKSKLAMSRRLSFRRSMDTDVTALTGLQRSPGMQCRENRQRQFAARASDLVSGYVLFARELPDVARLPVVAQMALVKACAPTFVLVRAVDLYNEEHTALIDERGDVVPIAVIDDLLSQSRQLSSTETSSCRRFFEFVSTVRSPIPSNGPGGSPDPTVIALLQAIALLSPELLPPDLLSQDALDELANAQQRHIFLLRQHLEATCSFDEAALLLPKLLSALAASKSNASYVSDLLLSCDAVRCDDLLAEILNGPPAVRIETISDAACAASKSPAVPPTWTDAGSDPVLAPEITSGANEHELGSLSSACAAIDDAQSFCILADNISDF